MKQFYLCEITTKDNLVHQGLYFEPSKKNKKAMLWVHGLTDNFYGDRTILETFTQYCESEGWGFASFNTRGHDVVASLTKVDPSLSKGRIHINGGAGYEMFKDCILDIDAGISFLINQGFSEIIIAGISTGANKVCYYEGTQDDHRVAGVALISPLSDVPIKQKELGKVYRATVKKVETLVAKRKADELILGYDYMPLTAARFLSLYRAGGAEDVFQYHREKSDTSVFAGIKKPLLVVLGGRDEYADRPMPDIKKFFDTHQRSSYYQSVIIPGGFHSYRGKEKEFVDAFASWIKPLWRH
jgi:alpha-beta hydrolase superfamily lysophospholipase